MRMVETLQFLGVVDPLLRHQARGQAVLECAPQLVEIFRGKFNGPPRKLTEIEQSEVDEEFKKIVDARTDEIMRGVIAARRSG